MVDEQLFRPGNFSNLKLGSWRHVDLGPQRIRLIVLIQL